jgi:hypothetical protein
MAYQAVHAVTRGEKSGNKSGEYQNVNYAPGDPINVSGDEAKRLLALGAIVEVTGSATKVAELTAEELAAAEAARIAALALASPPPA